MEPSRVILWVTILVIVTCLCYTALAKTVNGVGTHSFGADITENHSCSLAKIKAESDAIRNAFGETVGATDWKMCADDECLWNSFRWTDQQGQITSILNETKVILNNPRQCRISIVNIIVIFIIVTTLLVTLHPIKLILLQYVIINIVNK